MNPRGIASLFIALGVVLGSASAEEATWRPSQPTPPAPRRLVRIVPVSITLGRPVPVEAAWESRPRPRLVRAMAADLAPAVLPASVTEVADDSPPSVAEAKKPATSAAPAAVVTAFHPFAAVVFPYPSTHWTRTTNPGPASEFGPWGAAESPEDMGPPPPAASRFYGSGEYLLWWTRPASLPPLVTTGPPASQGILGQPGTVVLFGGAPVDFGGTSGARLTAGYWLDCEQSVAIEGSLFFLGQENVNFNASSSQFPVLARPFFAINPGPQMGEFRQLTSFPNLFTGAISASTATRLWGAELDARCKGCCGCWGGCGYQIDWLAGLRYLELNDSVHVNEAIQFTPGVLANLPAGGNGFVFDTFGTRNQFLGGQVGTQIELRHERWTLDLKAKVAVGDTHETININGGQRLLDPFGNSTTFRGGLLALPSNIGHFTRDEFGVVPELGLQIGYNVTEHFRAFVGYNFLYWSNVVRAGDQIDRNLDVTQIPNFSAPGAVPVGQTHPAVLFRETSFWAQGVTVGVEWKY